jgi:hypothetical protein
VVVDRLTKFGHFIPLTHPFNAKEVATLFFENIYKYHGLPATIISDRDSLFLSKFWSQVFKLLGTELHYTTAYHPQTDGQTERLNQCLESYLRCMTSDKPKDWCKWIHLAQWWYNSSYHSSIKLIPFEALFGYAPPQLSIPQQMMNKDSEVQEFLQDRKIGLQLLKSRLEEARSRMKLYADQNRTEREFEVGDWVFLRLQPYRQTTLSLRRDYKLAPKYYGPYQVLARIGKVAYKLQLPNNTNIHPVFHVSLLKKKLGNQVVPVTQLPVLDNNGIFKEEPIAILDSRFVQRGNKGVAQILVQWSNLAPEQATWESYDEVQQKFPHFDP